MSVSHIFPVRPTRPRQYSTTVDAAVSPPKQLNCSLNCFLQIPLKDRTVLCRLQEYSTVHCQAVPLIRTRPWALYKFVLY